MAQSTAILNRILARQMSSLLQYLRGAWPWTGTEDAATLEQLRRLMVEEQEACKRLADAITRRRDVPDTGKFHQGFSSSHYTALDHLLPWLVSYQRWLIGQLDKDLSQIRDDEDALECGRSLLEMNRRHLAELERLAKEHTGKRMVSTIR
jgi:hypothetical protein